MDALVTSIFNAVGSTAVGGGVVRFLHHVWWHMASILSWAWILSQGKGGGLTAVSGFFSYLGLPDGVRVAPLHARAWIVDHAETGVVAWLVLIIGLVVALRPLGEDATDEPMSPAGATALIMVLYLMELHGAGALGSVGLVVVLLLAVKWLAQGLQATLYAVIAPLLSLLFTPLTVGALLFSPAHAEPSGRPAGGSRVLK